MCNAGGSNCSGFGAAEFKTSHRASRLAAQADIGCRSEWWTQERRRQESFHASHPGVSSYNPAQPWKSVIKAAAFNQEFWNKDFDKPALLHKVRSNSAFPVDFISTPTPWTTTTIQTPVARGPTWQPSNKGSSVCAVALRPAPRMDLPQ